MRKKSHISLAQFIVKNSDSLELNQHKKAFYLGSILPDCKPSFLTEKHQFNGTFEKVQGYIRDLTENCVFEERDQRSYWRRVGEVVHYIADYFTFPHNDHYPGNVKDHCYYERDLKFGMRAFLETEEAAQIKEHVAAYDSVEELTSYIRSIHNSYMKLAHTVEEDIRYIVHACTTVVKSVMNMVSYAVGTSVMNIQYV